MQIGESDDEKLLGFTLHKELSFQKYVLTLYKSYSKDSCTSKLGFFIVRLYFPFMLSHFNYIIEIVIMYVHTYIYIYI